MREEQCRSFALQTQQPLAHRHQAVVAAAGHPFKHFQPRRGKTGDDVSQ